MSEFAWACLLLGTLVALAIGGALRTPEGRVQLLFVLFCCALVAFSLGVPWAVGIVLRHFLAAAHG